MSTTATPTDEMLMLAEVIGDVKSRIETLEGEFSTQARPLEAAIAGLTALKHHVLDSNIGKLSVRVDENRAELVAQIGNIAAELKRAEEELSTNKETAEAARLEVIALRKQLAEVDTQLASEVKRVEQLAKLPGPPGLGMTGRGIYDPEKTYQMGDVVSYLGASYLSQANDNDEKPGPKAKRWTQLVGRPSSY